MASPQGGRSKPEVVRASLGSLSHDQGVGQVKCLGLCHVESSAQYPFTRDSKQQSFLTAAVIHWTMMQVAHHFIYSIPVVAGGAEDMVWAALARKVRQQSTNTYREKRLRLLKGPSLATGQARITKPNMALHSDR